MPSDCTTGSSRREVFDFRVWNMVRTEKRLILSLTPKGRAAAERIQAKLNHYLELLGALPNDAKAELVRGYLAANQMLLPQPEGPRMDTNSFSRNSRSTPRRASMVFPPRVYCLVMLDSFNIWSYSPLVCSNR